MAIKKTAAEKAAIKAAANKAAADKYLAKVATQREKNAIKAANKAAKKPKKPKKGDPAPPPPPPPAPPPPAPPPPAPSGTTGTYTGDVNVGTDSPNSIYPGSPTAFTPTPTPTPLPSPPEGGDYYIPKFTVPTSTEDSPKAKGDKDVTTQQVITREPEYMENIRLNLLGAAADLTSRPKVLAEYKVAGMSPEQREAITMAREGIGAYEPYMEQAAKAYGQAGGLYAGTTGAYDPNSAEAYMNPYQAAVTQRAVEEMNRNAAIQRQDVAAQAVKSGAFGGSRFGVQQAELGRGLADIQSQRIMQDYSQNYSQAQTAAMNAFQNQQARAQTSAAGIAGLGTSTAAQGQQISALGQGDTSYLYNMGQKLQTQNQAGLEAGRLNQEQLSNAPYQQMSYYQDVLNKTPSGQTQTSTTSAPAASPISGILGLTAAGIGAYNAFK